MDEGRLIHDADAWMEEGKKGVNMITTTNTYPSFSRTHVPPCPYFFEDVWNRGRCMVFLDKDLNEGRVANDEFLRGALYLPRDLIGVF